MSTHSHDDSYQDEFQTINSNSDPPNCGILSRYPVGSVLAFAAVGICAGVGLSLWEVDNKQTLLQWVGLLGDLFLRALQAVVLPLVFVDVVLAIVDLIPQRIAGAVGRKLIGFYVLTATLASLLALVAIVIFRDVFPEGGPEEEVHDGLATIQLGCGENGSYLTYEPDGSVICSHNLTTSASQTFVVQNLDGITMDSAAASLSDTIYAGIFQHLVTSNVLGSFVEANFAALVVFAVMFAVALTKTVILPQQEHNEESSVMKLLAELQKVFSFLVTWVISFTPFAVLSLLAATIGGQDDLLEACQNVAILIATVLLAMVAHLVLIYGGLLFVFTGSKPKDYFRQLIPAQATAFAFASSVATIPITLHCVQRTKKVPPAVFGLVCPIGASINMDGGAIYFPIACVWLAALNGLEPSVGDYMWLLVMSTVGSAVTASIPAASPVLILSAYNSVFGTTGTPYGFSFLLTMDWFLDRCRVTLNVTGDAIIAALVASFLPAHQNTENEEQFNLSSTANLDYSDPQNNDGNLNASDISLDFATAVVPLKSAMKPISKYSTNAPWQRELQDQLVSTSESTCRVTNTTRHTPISKYSTNTTSQKALQDQLASTSESTCRVTNTTRHTPISKYSTHVTSQKELQDQLVSTSESTCRVTNTTRQKKKEPKDRLTNTTGQKEKGPKDRPVYKGKSSNRLMANLASELQSSYSDLQSSCSDLQSSYTESRLAFPTRQFNNPNYFM